MSAMHQNTQIDKEENLINPFGKLTGFFRYTDFKLKLLAYISVRCIFSFPGGGIVKGHGSLGIAVVWLECHSHGGPGNVQKTRVLW